MTAPDGYASKTTHTDIRVDQHLYRILFERSPDAVVVTAPDGAILDFNPAALDLFGLARSALQQANIEAFYAKRNDRDGLMASVDQHGLVHDVPTLFVDRQNQFKQCLVTAMRLDTPDGQVYGYQHLIRDVTDRRQAEKRLQDQKRYADQLIDIAPEAIAILDLEDRVIRVNEEFCRLFQYTRSACIGRCMERLTVPPHLKAESTAFSARVMAGECFEAETQRMRKDGSLVDVSVLAKPIFTEADEPAIYVFYRDITERRRRDETLRFVAYHDPLTGLPNRKSFYRRLDELLQQSNRRYSDRGWALMFLDLDRFKQVNDTLGHDTGDRLLEGVADRLQGSLRATDQLFRLGGDEFTVILTHLEQNVDVARVARKILKAIHRPFRLNGNEIFTSASIGISLFPGDGWKVEALVKNADMAMYAAKASGGDAYRFFTEEMNRKALARMQLENNLRKALQREELLLHYQPLVDREGAIVGTEALLRWNHPQRGLMLPADFMRICEETGIIVSVGRWVLETACEQTRRWHAMGFGDLFVSVNLAARQLREADFEKMVLDIIEASGLPPTRLRLEVSESGMMQNPEACIAKMRRLHAEGVTFAIDDFGTAYSSLSYLKRFPIDSLKIDRSFVSDAMRSRGDQEIIKSIIAMARNLDIDIVAEGIETHEQKDLLDRFGCSSMQGFLFAHPLPGDLFGDLLKQQKTAACRRASSERS